jgi:hypothetical protein
MVGLRFLVPSIEVRVLVGQLLAQITPNGVILL